MILSENQKILVRKWSKDLDTSAVIFDNWGNDLEFKDTGQIKDSVGITGPSSNVHWGL